MNKLTCCACGKQTTDRNILLANKKAPIPNTGWGCHICGLPADGAIATLCNDCFEKILKDKNISIIKYVYKGFPENGELFSIEKLTEDFIHDETKHAIYESKQYEFLH